MKANKYNEKKGLYGKKAESFSSLKRLQINKEIYYWVKKKQVL